MEISGFESQTIDYDSHVSLTCLFSGTPGVSGSTFGPTDMKDGMNMFLSDLGITFRRDELLPQPEIKVHGHRPKHRLLSDLLNRPRNKMIHFPYTCE